jgi:outer membrane protein
MRVTSLVTTGLLLLAAATSLEAQSLKIGYINSASILEQAPGAQEAQAQFNRDVQGFRTQVQQMADELQVMIENYEKQQLTLSPDAKARREEEIRQKQQAYQTRVQQLDQQAGARQQELVQPVMDRITEVIEQIRAEGDYALIFDVSAGSIIAGDPALDLTNEVVRRLAAAPGSGGRD